VIWPPRRRHHRLDRAEGGVTMTTPEYDAHKDHNVSCLPFIAEGGWDARQGECQTCGVTWVEQRRPRRGHPDRPGPPHQGIGPMTATALVGTTAKAGWLQVGDRVTWLAGCDYGEPVQVVDVQQFPADPEYVEITQEVEVVHSSSARPVGSERTGWSPASRRRRSPAGSAASPSWPARRTGPAPARTAAAPSPGRRPAPKRRRRRGERVTRCRQ
jgi:hypothetical protein